MLTTTRKETSIQSAWHHAFKTGPGMLPLFQTLEDSLADTPRQARNGMERYAGSQVVRGESGFGLRHRSGLGDSDCGTSRAFLARLKGGVSCGANR